MGKSKRAALGGNMNETVSCPHCGRKHREGLCVQTGKYTPETDGIEYGADEADTDFSKVTDEQITAEIAKIFAVILSK